MVCIITLDHNLENNFTKLLTLHNRTITTSHLGRQCFSNSVWSQSANQTAFKRVRTKDKTVRTRRRWIHLIGNAVSLKVEGLKKKKSNKKGIDF